MANSDENRQAIEAIEQKVKFLVTLGIVQTSLLAVILVMLLMNQLLPSWSTLVRSDCGGARLYVSQATSRYFGAGFTVHFCSFVFNPEEWVDQRHFVRRFATSYPLPGAIKACLTNRFPNPLVC